MLFNVIIHIKCFKLFAYLSLGCSFAFKCCVRKPKRAEKCSSLSWLFFFCMAFLWLHMYMLRLWPRRMLVCVKRKWKIHSAWLPQSPHVYQRTPLLRVWPRRAKAKAGHGCLSCCIEWRDFFSFLGPSMHWNAAYFYKLQLLRCLKYEFLEIKSWKWKWKHAMLYWTTWDFNSEFQKALIITRKLHSKANTISWFHIWALVTCKQDHSFLFIFLFYFLKHTGGCVLPGQTEIPLIRGILLSLIPKSRQTSAGNKQAHQSCTVFGLGVKKWVSKHRSPVRAPPLHVCKPGPSLNLHQVFTEVERRGSTYQNSSSSLSLPRAEEKHWYGRSYISSALECTPILFSVF